jgi:hypothetical protein
MRVLIAVAAIAVCCWLAAPARSDEITDLKRRVETIEFDNEMRQLNEDARARREAAVAPASQSVDVTRITRDAAERAAEERELQRQLR